MDSKNDRLSEYTYELPEDRIADFPTANREESRLLFYNGEINHHQFSEVSQLLPPNSNLVFNNTKVIPARLVFRRQTGAIIEIFLLQPKSPSEDMSLAMSSHTECIWECMIGNMKKWKGDILQLKTDAGILFAELIDRNSRLVKLTWDTQLSFSEILEATGRIPLPPYIKRKYDDSDKERYQTVYSRTPGAVAAPTAGLHFTERIMKELLKEGHQVDYLTLHVGAGTFQPIKTEDYRQHDMHSENFIVSRQLIEKLKFNSNTIAVGTTSLRTLETLYWYGVKLGEQQRGIPLDIDKNDMIESCDTSVSQAMENILQYAPFQDKQLKGKTRIYIYPGYRIRMIKGIITNFHMPGSSLILLIAALIGPNWKKVYQSALDNGYRFLSYGDSSLLLADSE